VPEYNREGFDLVRLIEKRLGRGGYVAGAEIGFNPREDVRVSDPLPGQRPTPTAMIQPVLAR
jgi:hypothetical protein